MYKVWKHRVRLPASSCSAKLKADKAGRQQQLDTPTRATSPFPEESTSPRSRKIRKKHSNQSIVQAKASATGDQFYGDGSAAVDRING